jgi:hypothetical protein
MATPSTEEVLAYLVRVHSIEEILWDVDGTLVPGDGLNFGQHMPTCIVDPDRFRQLLRGLKTRHTIASRNGQFHTESPMMQVWLRSLGFDGHMTGLCDYTRVKKPTRRTRALLIDDSVTECTRSIRAPNVMAAVHLRNPNDGLFKAIDTGHFTLHERNGCLASLV